MQSNSADCSWALGMKGGPCWHAGTDKAVDKVANTGLGDLLQNRGALIGTAMFLFQQLAGINAIIYFSSDVFAKVIQPGARHCAVPAC